MSQMMQVGKAIYHYGFTSGSVKNCRTMHIYNEATGNSLCGRHSPATGWVSTEQRDATSVPVTVCVMCDTQLARIRLEEAMLQTNYLHPITTDEGPW